MPGFLDDGVYEQLVGERLFDPLATGRKALTYGGATAVLFGPDVSSFQAGIDMNRVVAEADSFVIAKISEGRSYTNPAWPTQRDTARQAGLLLLGYHMISGDAPSLQAANCASWIGDKSIPIALDWEASGNSGNFTNFLAVQSAMRAAGLKVVLAYAPHWYWQQQGSPDMRAANIPLWASSYVAGTGTPTALYSRVPDSWWSGYGGLQVALLQFSSSATVAGMSIDCSAFRGTRNQLATLFGAAPAPAPSPRPREDPVIPYDWPAGSGAHKLVCPVGAMSAVTAKAWLSLACDGVLGRYDVWFQSDRGGMTEFHGTLAKDQRAWWAFPDGATQATVHYTGATGAVGAAIEILPK